jgi:hypothetical protein
VGFERELDAKGERMIWVEAAVAERLRLMRGRGESYSDVILRDPPRSRRDHVRGPLF